MAEIVKFNERNIAMFGLVETTPGTYNAPAAINALAATALSGAITYETGAFKFLGDNLSRDEYTFIKDSYADVSLDSFQQVLGGLDTVSSGSTIVSNFALTNFYQACGGYMYPITTTAWNGHPVGSILVDNVNASTSTLSIDYRKKSIQDTVFDKLTKFLYVRGMVDISASLGDAPTLKFTLKGNASLPIASPQLIPSFGQQASQVAATLRKQNVVYSTITPIVLASGITSATTTATVTAPNHGLAVGTPIEVTGVKINSASLADSTYYNGTFVVATVPTTSTFTYIMTGSPGSPALGSPVILALAAQQSFNFSTLSAPNFFGFDLTRYLTATEEGFTTDATPTDVSVGMVENQSPGWVATSITSATTTATVTIPNIATVLFPYVTTAGSAGVTGGNTFTVASATGIANGSPVSGVGIPASSYVTISGTTVTVLNLTTGLPALLTANSSGNYAFGNQVTISGATNALFNGTFSVVSTSGNTFTYTLSSTASGASAVADNTGSLKVINLNTPNFDPELNITNFFAVAIKFGTGAGKYVTYRWNKLQLTTVKDGKVANLFSKDVTFRNTGKSYIFFE